MKVLFLDFDGVMNSAEWMKKNHEAFKTKTSWLERDAAELDAELVQRVMDIIDATGAAVVISSSWRLLHSLEELGHILKMAGFPQFAKHIIDRTPDRLQDYRRGVEIDTWIKAFEKDNGPLESFVILDDDSDMLDEQLPSFVNTSWETGLLAEQATKAIEILGRHRVEI